MDFLTLLRAMWDRIAAWVLIIGGLIALVLGWTGASGTAYPAEQIPFVISGAILGLFLLGLGSTLLISADLRDEWRQLDKIEDAILSSPMGANLLASNGASASAPDTNGAPADTSAVEDAAVEDAAGEEASTETPQAEPRRRGRRIRR